MSKRIPRTCATFGCSTTTTTGQHCAAHRPKRVTEAKPWEQVYRTYEWQQTRLRVIARDPDCSICGAEPSTYADHIIPLRELYNDGGWLVNPHWLMSPYDMDNLRGVCATCSGKRTARKRGGAA